MKYIFLRLFHKNIKLEIIILNVLSGGWGLSYVFNISIPVYSNAYLFISKGYQK